MTPPAETRPASWPGTLGLTALAMLAFAGNSLLCRLALKQSAIDPTSFTTIRLATGALERQRVQAAPLQAAKRGAPRKQRTT